MTMRFIQGLAVAAIFAICMPGHAADVSAHLSINGTKKDREPPAVLWLKPLQQSVVSPAPRNFTLLQKDKMFHPHLLVVPVGSSVNFPNADPFFHNVFSLFDGRRFDLGLYEAGSSRAVTFPREGISYIFCNIHPDMSAVVLSLDSPFFSEADMSGTFHMSNVPEGDYELHLWVEGRPEEALSRLVHRIHVSASGVELGELQVGPREQSTQHLNKFGKPYDKQNSY